MSAKKNKRTAAVFLGLALILIVLSSCKKTDPYEGMALVPNGAGGEMWITVLDELAVSTFAAEDFSRDGEYINYRGEEYSAWRGIDVSEHQQEIDWEAVRGDGVDFAIIRAGYRGYSEGILNEDKYFRQNIEGALNAGLKVGIYFFSQAISVEEAVEEAGFLLELIKGYEVVLPVFYDWEAIDGTPGVRTEGIAGSEITGFALAFCKVIENAGYNAGVYFYRSLGYNEYELDRLAGIVFWSAAVGEYPDFYYAHTVWQYSYTGKVSGIEADTDLNILFARLPESDGAEDATE